MNNGESQLEFLDQLFEPFNISRAKETEITDKDLNNTNESDLYDILNSCKNSRQIMNKLFNKIERDSSEIDQNLTIKCMKITEQWKEDSLRSNSQMNNTDGLQSDIPIKFSWSKNGKIREADQSKDELKNEIYAEESKGIILKTAVENDSNKLTSSNNTTNQNLYKIIFQELKKIRETNLSWQDILDDENPIALNKGFIERVSRTTDTHSELFSVNGTNDDSIINNNGTTKSNFTVNPLEKFHPQELPRTKKTPEVKKKHKRSSKLWFWGKKNKHKGKKKDNANKDKIEHINDDNKLDISENDDKLCKIKDLDNNTTIRDNEIDDAVIDDDDEFGEFNDFETNNDDNGTMNTIHVYRKTDVAPPTMADIPNSTLDDLLNLPINNELGINTSSTQPSSSDNNTLDIIAKPVHTNASSDILPHIGTTVPSNTKGRPPPDANNMHTAITFGSFEPLKPKKK